MNITLKKVNFTVCFSLEKEMLRINSGTTRFLLCFNFDVLLSTIRTLSYYLQWCCL